MKKNRYIFNWCIGLVAGILLTGCEKTDYMTYDPSFMGVYFTEDSTRYSFGVTPLDVETYVMKLPVKIMGTPTKEKRVLKFEVVADSSTAIAGKHYRLPAECVIEADSVNGVLELEIIREELGDVQKWRLMVELLENDNFSPLEKVGARTVAIFSNVVEPPAWKDWEGNPTWPDDKLGPWNPVVWVKFMEFFRKIEETNPMTYQMLVKQLGPNLENVEYGWPYDYDFTFTKYVLIPLYAFFQEHPEYEVEMPNPGV